MNFKKKLIEVALPLKAINKESAREKSIRHGHPSTLHLWWSRKPTATARAVIWASLVDDPSSLPEKFPTEEAQAKERQRLFGILERLVKWENSNNEDVLAEAKAEIMKSTDGNPPALLDPFAGGGSIPLEAQRLGLKVYAGDLNPVAVMINKAMIEIPPKFEGQRPINPEAKMHTDYHGEWKGAQGLAKDVRYYGEWMRKKAFECIGHLYPKVKDEHEQEHTVIAWIWARTVRCPNPACGCRMPLVGGFELSKKKGRKAFVQPIIEGKKIRYEVRYGENPPKSPKKARGRFGCIVCGNITSADYIDNEASKKRMGCVPIAIVAEGHRGRQFLSADLKQMRYLDDLIQTYYEENNISEIVPHEKTRGTFASNAQGRYYGFFKYKDYFTQRQLIALATYSKLVMEARKQIIKDGACEEYANAVAVYLAFGVDRSCNYWSTLNTWGGEFIVQAFARQGIAIMWDYAESNPFSTSTGCWLGAIDWIVRVINKLPIGGNNKSESFQSDAQIDNGFRNIMVSTDPPYYDNIIYSDLSDYFYVWLRLSLKNIYTNLFRTVLVPKVEELVVSPYRFDGSVGDAKKFFENGMLQAFKQIYCYSKGDVPMTVYYAYMQREIYSENNTSLSGWETMLTAIIKAGFTIVGTWPIRTERSGGFRNYEQNVLASSIVLVCRKRPIDAPMSTRRDFINALKRELKPALRKLQASNIAPVDMAQSAIGPGMSVFSRFSKVLEADGTPMGVRSALQIINQELDLYFTEQDGGLDGDSRFCVDLYTQYAFNDMKFGEADVLARAKNTSVDKLVTGGVLYAQKGVVRLLTRDEIPKKIDSEIIWLFTQQLTCVLEKEGVEGAAKIVADILTSEPEHAKSLAYRLFTIAENKGWAKEAYAYNSLVIAWPDIQSKAAELRTEARGAEQIAFIDIDN